MSKGWKEKWDKTFSNLKERHGTISGYASENLLHYVKAGYIHIADVPYQYIDNGFKESSAEHSRLVDSLGRKRIPQLIESYKIMVENAYKDREGFRKLKDMHPHWEQERRDQEERERIAAKQRAIEEAEAKQRRKEEEEHRKKQAVFKKITGVFETFAIIGLVIYAIVDLFSVGSGFFRTAIGLVVYFVICSIHYNLFESVRDAKPLRSLVSALLLLGGSAVVVTLMFGTINNLAWHDFHEFWFMTIGALIFMAFTVIATLLALFYRSRNK